MKRINPIINSAVVDEKQQLTFTFQGKKYQGLAGDCLASALLANGVYIFAKSYKYSRPRGVMAAYAEEPNALVSLEQKKYHTPNVRATTVELYQDLWAVAPTLDSNLFNQLKPLFKWMHKFMPAGFYYKTFMHPQKLWMCYEKFLRGFAGISKAPTEQDAEHYDYMHHNVDIVIIGGGIAGLTAAMTLVNTGKKILIVDDKPQLGGLAYDCPNEIVDGQSQLNFVKAAITQLQQQHNISILSRTTAFAFHDENNIIANQLRQDHIPLAKRGQKISRQRLHKIKAGHVLLATGASERPIAFDNNDLPGIMLASAGLALLNRYSILAGEYIVIFTNNDFAYEVANYLILYAKKVTIVDVRDEVTVVLPDTITLIKGCVVAKANGKNKISSVTIANLAEQENGIATNNFTINADLLLVAGGFNPIVHLDCHTGCNPYWDETLLAFMPKLAKANRSAIGALTGFMFAKDIVQNAKQQAQNIISANYKSTIADTNVLNTAAFFAVPNTKGKQFVDLQNDVTTADIQLSIRENYKCIEHIKRYTALGFGTDQGKTSNVLGVAIAAQTQNISIAEVGTTTFRPAYTPVAFGALAGQHVGDLFEPKRYTPMQQSHINNQAEFETVGQWMRPWYFSENGEDLDKAVYAECLQTRKSLGLIDASTLGKIEIHGADAREFLARVYTNNWAKLPIGCCRYGLMLNENGMIMDDGVVSCLTDQHFLITTTTGGAAAVYQWLEMWLQTEWQDLEVYLTSVTDHFATAAVVGPNSRKLMQTICNDIDFSKEKFPFMSWREGTVCGVAAKVMRISFSGELAFEINMQANYGRYIWDNIIAAGKKYNIVQYGTESMHVLRAEKGYIIVGQDTDGSVSPIDADLSWAVADKKPFSFIGKRSLSRSDTCKKDRKQLVGILTEDKNQVLPEGAQILNHPQDTVMLGHITSSYFSPILNRSIALGLVRGGLERKADSIYVASADGRRIKATISSYVFYDPKGLRVDGAENETTNQQFSQSRSPIYESALESYQTQINEKNWKTTEHKQFSYIVIRGKQQQQNFVNALAALGLELPPPMHITINTNGTLIWISPDEFLLLLDNNKKDIFLGQATKVFSNIFAVALDNSGSFVQLEISGEKYLNVLSKLSPYDFSTFKKTQVLSSYLGKAPSIVYKHKSGAITILVRSSFADYLWRLMENASLEYR